MKDDVPLPYLIAAGAAAVVGGFLLSGRRLVMGYVDGVPRPMTVMDAGNGQFLRSDAAAAFKQMVAAARADGLDLRAGSAFRDLSTQTLLYLKWKAGLYDVPSVALPGFSNHQGGVAVDIADGNGRSVTTSSPLFAWMTSNAGNFGFSWAEGRSINEPWHWDYVG